MSELRYFEGKVEQRGEEGRIFGYGAVFDSPSRILFSKDIGEFIETIDKRAFDSILKDPNLVITANHDKNLLLGRTGSGTALVGVDERGFWFDVKPPESRADILESVKRGDMAGASFSFDVGEEEWTQEGRDLPRRHVRSFKSVFDVGPVTYPAYLETTVATRSYQNFMDTVGKRKEVNNLSLEKMKLFFYENSIII